MKLLNKSFIRKRGDNADRIRIDIIFRQGKLGLAKRGDGMFEVFISMDVDGTEVFPHIVEKGLGYWEFDTYKEAEKFIGTVTKEHISKYTGEDEYSPESGHITTGFSSEAAWFEAMMTATEETPRTQYIRTDADPDNPNITYVFENGNSVTVRDES